MSNSSIHILLSFSTGTDAREREELTRNLRDELLNLDVETVSLINSGKMPPGSKGVDPFSWGQLLLTGAASGGVLTTLINILPDWLNRNNQRSVTLKIGDDILELTGISSEEQQRLTDIWLSRHRDFLSAR